MDKTVGNEILGRLARMRKGVVDEMIVRPGTGNNVAEELADKPYVFLRQRVEKPGWILLGINDAVELIGFIIVMGAAVFAAICLGH